MESGTGPTKAPSRPHIAILNIVGVIALLDELVVRGSVRAREGFVLRSAELQPTYVAMSFFFLLFFSLYFYCCLFLYPKLVTSEESTVELDTLLGFVCLSTFSVLPLKP